jgi:hypothetical protein
MTDPLRARLTALIAALETHGWRAFPCATCGREGDVRVHDLHTLLAALLPASRPDYRDSERLHQGTPVPPVPPIAMVQHAPTARCPDAKPHPRFNCGDAAAPEKSVPDLRARLERLAFELCQRRPAPLDLRQTWANELRAIAALLREPPAAMPSVPRVMYDVERQNIHVLIEEIEYLRVALDESVKLQSHYAELLNMHDGGQRIGFEDGKAWIARLCETGTLAARAGAREGKS